MPTSEEGRKFDAGKPRMDLLPPRAVEQVARVLGYGAVKYGDSNWERVEGWRGRYVAAALRHTFAYMRGEDHDAESGLPHLAHAITSLLFVLEKEERGA